jgi:hypothetical protein
VPDEVGAKLLEIARGSSWSLQEDTIWALVNFCTAHVNALTDEMFDFLADLVVNSQNSTLAVWAAGGLTGFLDTRGAFPYEALAAACGASEENDCILCGLARGCVLRKIVEATDFTQACLERCDCAAVADLYIEFRRDNW